MSSRRLDDEILFVALSVLNHSFEFATSEFLPAVRSELWACNIVSHLKFKKNTLLYLVVDCFYIVDTA